MDQKIDKLARWEMDINKRYPDIPYIRVKNDVDNEGPPIDFTYVAHYVSNISNVIIEDDNPVIGCDCRDCYKNSNCCPGLACQRFAYNRDGKLRIEAPDPIFECNKKCLCDINCTNRVVQKGPKIRVEIFKTSYDCGWGLRTLDNIERGTFVCEYVGEIIQEDEVTRRERDCDYETSCYLFKLDFDETHSPYTIDATHYGNVSRFINHSCEPNLKVYPVFINQANIHLPRLAFFTCRSVQKGEELVFDYNFSKNDENKWNKNTDPVEWSNKRILCKCGTLSCRKYLT